MSDNINNFASAYMHLCKAAYDLAPLVNNPGVDKQQRIAAENTYHTALQNCESLAHRAYPQASGFHPLLDKCLNEAKANTASLPDFKTASYTRVIRDIDAQPKRILATSYLKVWLGGGNATERF